MKKKQNISKDDFLDIMKSISVKDMQKMIESKGKEPKPFNPIMHDRR